MSSILSPARAAYAAGLCILPVRADGSKKPDLNSWAEFQASRPTPEQMRAFNFAAHDGFGMVAGPVSAFRESWDFDCANSFETFVSAAGAIGLGDVVARIRAAYEDRTPRGGVRWVIAYPRSEVWQDCTLAKRPKRPEEMSGGTGQTKTLIELPTFNILAPSNGRTHETGMPYVRVSGDFHTIPSYTAEERADLMALARTFDQMPRPEAAPRRHRPSIATDGDRPGDDFNRRAEWEDLLPDWTLVYERGGTLYLRRPGKERGVSATINHGGSDRLHVFSTSTEFDAERSYDKFGAYARLHHRDDYGAAACALAKEGYGQRLEAPSASPPVKSPSQVLVSVVTKLDAIAPETAAYETGQPAAVVAAAAASVPSVKPEEAVRPSQATKIVDLALAAGAEFWHTETGDPHVTLSIGRHREHHAVRDGAFRDYLARLFYLHTARVPAGSATTDAINTLSGMARFEGDMHAVHVRVAGHDDAVYVDLGDADWSAIEITPTGWHLVADAPVRFRRGRALLAMPVPVPGGSLDALRDVIHCDDDHWLLMVAWLLGALRPAGPYPVLALDGEQGAGKSTTARFLRGLIDPSGAELRSEPRDIRDLMIAASGGRVIALDNVSHLQPWLSDALCRISTGGALSTRQLYTNGDEHIVEAIRPILITGITTVITRGDLLDRSIAITLPSISEAQRRSEADLHASYARVRSAALGAVLDGVACALRRECSVRLPKTPRMADFAIWVTAGEPALGVADGAFVCAYNATRQEAIEHTLEGEPVAVALRGLPRPWEGTATELLSKITPSPKPRGWPESPRGLGGTLRRLAPLLRSVCIVLTLDRREPHTGRRLIVIDDAAVEPSPPSPPSPTPVISADPGDGSQPPSRPTVTGPSPNAVSAHGLGDDGDGGDGGFPRTLVPIDANDRRHY